ncbi:MAG: hypothetical protein JXQ73_16790 [Phycisphaerae bacterium]|nr:hypothetical protein [Phycisphaerae bacterium]
MRWKDLRINSGRIACTGLVLLFVAGMAGCAHAINPFADEGVPKDEMTTASERVARDASATPVIRKRQWEQTTTSYPSGAVVHWPLWFEDPFEDKGSEDGKFAWTAEDYLAMPYSCARLLLNTIGWPVSAVVTPPGTPMVSDGRLSRQALGMDHDATRLSKRAAPAPEDESTEATDKESGQLAGESDPPAEEVGPQPPTVAQQAHFEKE